jgi:hypothetical protein
MSRHVLLPYSLVLVNELPGRHDEGIRMLPNVRYYSHARTLVPSICGAFRAQIAQNLLLREEEWKPFWVREAFREPRKCAHFRTRAMR